MAADLDVLSGDVAGLIDYRRHHDGMSYAPPRRNAICELHINGDTYDVFPDIATGGRCGTCYSTDPAIVIGPICPDEWHDGPRETHWRRIALQSFAITVALISLLALFLFTIGVI